jgi:hypothetical protein
VPDKSVLQTFAQPSDHTRLLCRMKAQTQA